MKSQQIIYPNTSQNIVLSNVTYLQLGVERPYSVPLSENEGIFKTVFTIIADNKRETYTITDKDILEFNNIYVQNLKIEIESNNPYLIIDLTYETAD